MKYAVGNYVGRLIRVDQDVWTLARDNKILQLLLCERMIEFDR